MSRGARRAWTVVGLIVAAGVIFAAAVLLWPTPLARAGSVQAAGPALIARGAYVATAADCIACHTTEGGRAYAGGRAFRLPFGTIYAPNITPDRETGIGAWTDGEFLRAVRHGVGRDGEELYPAFPYTSYAQMTDGDALAVKAYLFSLAPVRQLTPVNGLVFPFNQRPLMRFWKLLFFRSGEFRGDPARGADWNRGAYLVQVLGHCGECHTPRNLIFGFSGRKLAGETMQGWTAWNITSDARHGIGGWRADEIAAYLGYGYAPGRGAASGPMKEAVDFSLSKLTAGDRMAMALYLKTVPGSAQGPEASIRPRAMVNSTLIAPAATEITSRDSGLHIFEGACASCHAWNGDGQQTPAAALAGRRSVHDPDARNVVQTVLRGGGVRTPAGHAFMPAFGRAYSDAEIAAVSAFVVRHFGGVDARVTPASVRRARAE